MQTLKHRASRYLFAGIISTMALVGCAQLDLKPNDQIFLDADVLFDFGNDKLTPDGQRQIAQYVPSIKARGETWITIIGHTDRIGDSKYNDDLSLRRAESVRSELIQGGLDPDSVTARGAGSRNPIVECPDQNREDLIRCLAPNRRVQIDISDVKW